MSCWRHSWGPSVSPLSPAVTFLVPYRLCKTVFTSHFPTGSFRVSDAIFLVQGKSLRPRIPSDNFWK